MYYLALKMKFPCFQHFFFDYIEFKSIIKGNKKSSEI